MEKHATPEWVAAVSRHCTVNKISWHEVQSLGGLGLELITVHVPLESVSWTIPCRIGVGTLTRGGTQVQQPKMPNKIQTLVDILETP